MEPEEGISLLGMNSIRIFMSYTTHNAEEKKRAGKLKHYLEQIGFEVFLAHEDLGYCKNYPKELVKRLKSSEVFICLLSSTFVEHYEWTVPEVGIAYSENKLIIPLMVDKVVPFGFIKEINGIKIRFKSDETIASEIYEIITDDERFKTEIKDFAINRLIESKGFYEANARANALKDFSFNKVEINRLVQGVNNNGQIWMAWTAQKILTKIFKKNQKWIPQYIYSEVMSNIKILPEKK